MDSDPRRSETLYLTLDIESDYGRSDSYEILSQAAPFIDWLHAENIPLTAFVVGKLFQQGHSIIDTFLRAGISLGVHGFSHSPDTFGTMHASHADEIQKGMEAFEKRVGRKPDGYRAALGIVSRDDVLLMDKLGFCYDASIFPMRRSHCYDFSGLPKSPFQWQGTNLVEIPLGMLTATLPAGMTFINLLGSELSAFLVKRQVSSLSGDDKAFHVTDLHFHNLFPYYPAMNSLPFIMRLVYQAGSIMGGLVTLRRYVAVLRSKGFVFGNLETDALSLRRESLPVVGLDCFNRML
ncbi:MAG: hypothetical protein A2283_05735 [Lentisphaerae bacterium RIFOXYA12_FULL_48_11]|nr:MAG: hypothetical protein A2283_05735 [Lentisphaerae bacterium RIFOXYA12_FULL_48_11]